MPKKTRMPESPLDNEPWPRTDKEDLKAFLSMCEAEFQQDTRNALPAFEALTYCVAHHWRKNRHPKELKLPWWAAEVLCAGYLTYKDQAQTNNPVSLGQAYNIEAQAQGKGRAVATSLRRLRDLRIALAIALLREEGWKMEAALEKTYQEVGLSITQIKRIWRKYGKRAREQLKKLREATSS